MLKFPAHTLRPWFTPCFQLVCPNPHEFCCLLLLLLCPFCCILPSELSSEHRPGSMAASTRVGLPARLLEPSSTGYLQGSSLCSMVVEGRECFHSLPTSSSNKHGSNDSCKCELLTGLEWSLVGTGLMTATSRCLKYHRDPLMGYRNAFILIDWLQLERHMILILAISAPFQRDIYKSINRQNSSADRLIEVPQSITPRPQCHNVGPTITPERINQNNHRKVSCLTHVISCTFYYLSAFVPLHWTASGR